MRSLAALDPPIADSSSGVRAHGVHEIHETAERRHSFDRVSALLHQIERKPAQYEVEDVVAAKMSERGAERGSIPHDVAEGRRVLRVLEAARGKLPRWAGEPRHQPNKRERSEREE